MVTRPPYDVGHGGRDTLVGHVDHADARRALEHFGREMGRGAGAGARERKLARPGLRQRDKVLDGLAREGRRNDDYVGLRVQLRDGREVLAWIVRQPGIEAGIDRERRRDHQHGVAIRRGLRRDFRPYDGRRAGARIDDDVLTPFLGQLLPDQPRADIEPAARCKRHDHADRPVGIVDGVLRKGSRGERCQCNRRNTKKLHAG
jgi:hypothetical protein